MSTLKVAAIQDASGGNTATINSMTPTADSLQGQRNRIINGDMRIAQRGTAAVTTSSSYPVDRFFIANGTDGVFSAQQDSSAPAGFVNSLKFTTTTADASLGATQYVFASQSIEGTNLSDLAWGTASAKTVTLSFWVRSSLTGTFGGSLRNSGDTRSYPFTYTISVADTWEYKTVTIAGDTSGTWLTTTGVGISLSFSLGVGSTYTGTAGAWAGTNYVNATGAVSVIGTLNATWYITGVQLEVGSTATPFERRPYGTELNLCQRYFQLFGSLSTPAANIMLGGGMATSGTAGMAVISLVQEMRTSPSLTFSSTASAFRVVNSSDTSIACNAVPTANVLGNKAIRVSFGVASGITAGDATILFGDTSNAAWIGASSEL